MESQRNREEYDQRQDLFGEAVSLDDGYTMS